MVVCAGEISSKLLLAQQLLGRSRRARSRAAKFIALE
jgi:hypothetical protein